jgi:hypothetical protein
MRFLGCSIIAVAVAILPACKRHPPEGPSAPAPTAAPPAPVGGPVDALNPPPPPRPDLWQRPDTANGDPNGPKQADLDAAQSAAQGRVQACLDALPPTSTSGGPIRLSIKYTIGNDGKATDVTVTGSAVADVTACGTSALAQTPFPRFEGAKLSNSFTLSYSPPRALDLSTPPR